MIAGYYFLFGLAFVWIIFAVVQDLRKTEIANWLNFSLMGFALAYRAFYSISNGWMFFVYGLLGLAFFVALANLFYYAGVFAGGDAKLLMGLGAVLPFQNYLDFIYLGLGFVFILFLAGAVYSLIYTLFIAFRNLDEFIVHFKIAFLRTRHGFYFLVLVAAVLAFVNKLLLLVLPFYFVLIYLVAIDNCMIKLVPAGELVEGDWLLSDVMVGKRRINKTVHGLSIGQIKMLQKAKRPVLIKGGIPFSPAFLIAFLVMVYVFSFLSLPFLA